MLHGRVSEICLNAFPKKEWKLHKDTAFPLSFLKLTFILSDLVSYLEWKKTEEKHRAKLRGMECIMK